MPRNSSGNYTLPAGNPVVPDTLIEAAWANPTMADLGAEITNSLDRQGRGTMLAPLKLFDGTVVTPGLSFNSESSTGLYRAASHVLGIAVAGVAMALFTDTDVTFTKNIIAQQAVTVTGTTTLNGTVALAGVVSLTAPLNLPLGSAALPALTFTGDPNTGFYSPGADQVAWATGGAQRGTVSPAGNWALLTPTSGTTLALGVVAAGANAITASDGTNVLQIALQGVAGGFVGTATAAPFAIGTNGTTRLGINAAGNLTANAPSSGVTLQLTNANEALRLVGDTAYLAGFNALNTVRAGYLQFALGAVNLAADGGGTSSLAIFTGGAARLQIGAAGNVTVNAPSSGSHVVHCVDNALSVLFNGVTKGVRFGFSSASSLIEGVDNTGGASYQPLGITGSTLALNYSGGATALAINATGNVTINQPVSGNTLTVVSGTSGADVIRCVGDGATIRGFNNANSVEAGYVSFNTSNAEAILAGTGAAGTANSLSLVTGNTRRLTITPAGITTINNPATGDNSTQAATTNFVQQHSVGGKSMSWQAPGGRAFSTDFTAPNYPIMVSVICGFASAGTASLLIAGTITAATVQSSAGSFVKTLCAVIPPNTVYRVNISGSPTLNGWAELR